MNTKIKCKRMIPVLLSAMMAACQTLSLQAPLRCAALGRAARSERAVPFGSVDRYEAGSYSADQVNVLLKQSYSRHAERLLEQIFADPQFSGYEVLSDAETANPEDFRLFVSAKLRRSGNAAIRRALTYLQQFDEIYYAGPNRLFKIEARLYPISGAASSEDGGVLSSAEAFDLIGLYDAWNITSGSKSVVIGNNEGVYYDHEDLADQMWVNPFPETDELHGVNFSRADRSVYDDRGGGTINGEYQQHYYDHGTLTGSIMCADGTNDVGSAGVAYGTQLICCQANGVAQFQQMISFLNKNQVKVLNISVSWGKDNEEEKVTMPAALKSFNGLIVCSAGNDGVNLDETPVYPASYARSCTNVISVLATDNAGKPYSYSNYGKQTVTIAAPSEVVGAGVYKPQSNPDAAPVSDYWIGGGTSSAAPVVAGVAALIYSANPTLTAKKVKQTLLNSADRVSALNGKVQNSRLLNAYEAVKSVSCDAGTYFIRSRANNRYLDLSASTGALICHDFNGNSNQQYTFFNGALQSVQNGMYITDGESYADGFLPAVGADASDIAVAKDTSGHYRIIKAFRVPENGGENVKLYALEIANPGAADSAVYWEPYNSSSINQQWDLETAAPDESLESGIYRIRNARSKRLLDVNEITGKVLQYDANGGINQKWQLIAQGSGKYLLKTCSAARPGYLNCGSGKEALIVNTNGMYVTLYENSDGTFRVHIPGTYNCLHVRDDSTASAVPVMWDTFRFGNGDRWQFEKIG